MAIPEGKKAFTAGDVRRVPVSVGEFCGFGAAAAQELVVTQSVDSESLRHLLERVASEDCAHSWKNFGIAGSLEALRRWENERRPTELFFFHLKHGHQMRMVAAAAVADRLKHGFQHPGFCVLGRCYIMPEFRGQGLYRRVLHYRLEYCRARFGTALKAVHIGSDNAWIARVITNHRLPGWPRFLHLGQEELTVGRQIKLVDAYLLMLPEYLRKIRSALAGMHAPECVLALRKALAAVDCGDIRDLGIVVRDALGDARARGWFEQRDSNELEQIVAFCRSVPLVGLR